MKHTLLLLLLVLSITSIKAQPVNNLFVGILSETISFPLESYLPIHPGLELGTTFWQKQSPRLAHQANVFLGGYHHKKYENGFFLRVEYQPRFIVKETLGIDVPIGFGYLHSFYSGQVYAQNTNGAWEVKKQSGEPNLIVSGGLGVSYLKLARIQPFIRHENVVNFPLANDVQVIRTFLKLGVCVKIAKD